MGRAQKGNPRCWDCSGKGYVLVSGRWRPCGCIRPRADVAALMRKVNTRSDQPYRSTQERWEGR